MQEAPKSVAARSPAQLATGCGAFQRRSPTGAAAKGTPLKEAMPSSSEPTSTPLATVARGLPSAATVTSGAEVEQAAMKPRAATPARMRFMFLSPRSGSAGDKEAYRPVKLHG